MTNAILLVCVDADHFFKVMYIAATVPYVLLTILLVRGATLPGAWDGFKYYAIPRMEQLGSFTVRSWQVIAQFFSSNLYQLAELCIDITMCY